MASLEMVDLVGVGLNATDTVVSLGAFPAAGSKVEFQNAYVLPGGMVATTVMACRHWGLTTRYVGKLGEDAAGELHRAEFARIGVESRAIPVAGCDSQQSVILVDGSGERTVLWKRDGRLTLKAEELDREWIVNARALHVDGYDTGAAVQAAKWARAARIPVVADLDDIYVGVEELLPLIDYLIVSRDFPLRLTSERELLAALKTMQERYGAKLAAATLGPECVLAWDGAEWHYCRAYRVPVVDTTGAGDVFHAGFLYGLLREWEMDRTLNFACAAAALNCTAIGARGGIVGLETIEELMATGERYAAAF